MSASISARVKMRIGPPGCLEFRSAVSPVGSCASSTQFPWPLLRWLFCQWTPRMAAGMPSVKYTPLGLSQDRFDDAWGLLWRLAVDAEPVHSLEVPVNVLGLVEIKRACELLDVDDVGQIRLGKSEQGKCAGLRMTAHPKRQDLERDVRLLRLEDEVLELIAEHLRSTDRPPQDSFVHDRPEPSGF